MKKHFHGLYGSPNLTPSCYDKRVSMLLFFHFFGALDSFKSWNNTKESVFRVQDMLKISPKLYSRIPRDTKVTPRPNQCTQLVCSNGFRYYQQVHLNDLPLTVLQESKVNLKTVEDTPQIWLYRSLVNISNLINLMAFDKSL